MPCAPGCSWRLLALLVGARSRRRGPDLGADVALVEDCADVEVVVVPAYLDPSLQIIRDGVQLLVLVSGDVHHVVRPLGLRPRRVIEFAVDYDRLAGREFVRDVVRRVLVQHAPVLRGTGQTRHPGQQAQREDQHGTRVWRVHRNLGTVGEPA